MTDYNQKTNIRFNLRESETSRDEFQSDANRFGTFATVTTIGLAYSLGKVVQYLSHNEINVFNLIAIVGEAALSIMSIGKYLKASKAAKNIDYQIFENTQDIENCFYPDYVQKRYNKEHGFE